MKTISGIVFIACCAVLVAPASANMTQDRTTTHHRYFAREANSCPLHWTAGGTLVDCHGWRKRDNVIGWDNTCFNLNYLPSQFACSSSGGGF